MQEQDIDLEKEKTAHSLENLQVDVDRFYTEMAGLEVKLDLTITPDIIYINNKMVAIREASQRAQRMYLKIQRAIGISQKWLLNLETSCEILVNSKLENDVDVRAGQTGDERKAIAGNQLVGYKRAIREAKNNVSLLKSLNKAIDLCIKNLDRTDADVKQQSRLMEAQMRNLKSRDVGEAARDTFLRRTESDMDELEKLSEELNSPAASTVLVGSDDTLEPTVAVCADSEEAPAEEELVTSVSTLEEVSAPETLVQPVGAMMGDDDDLVVAAAASPTTTAALIDDDDDVIIPPGLTGPVAMATEGTEGDLLNFLGSIPEVTSRKDAQVVAPATTDTDSGVDDSTVDTDDVIGTVLDMDDGVSDLEDTTVVSVDDGDVFGGLVESSTVTEQKPPKLVREELQKDAALAASKSSKPVTAPPAAKAATVPAKAEAAPKATPAPKTAPVQKTEPATAPAESEDNLDKLMSDLGL